MRKVFLWVLIILTIVSTIAFSQVTYSTPLARFYYEVKALLENPNVDIREALESLLQKYEPVVEPILPPGEYEEYSLRLSELDKALLENGIWITRATVEIFNQEVVEGPFLLNYDRETGQATGLITKLKAGKYNIIVKVLGLIDKKDERIVAYGRKDGVEVVRDRISLANIPLNVLVGSGGVLINALIDFQNTEFIPGEIENVEPTNGATDVLPNVTLSWSSKRAKTYDIYFGEEGNIQLIEKNYFDNKYEVKNLKPSTTYQWKVVAKNTFGETESPVFSFKIGDAPTVPENPVPYDGAQKVWIEPRLMWQAERAASYDIYLGKSPDELQLVATVDEPEYDTEPLELGTAYYWKVVAKNAYGETEGPVWSFSTGDVPTKPELVEPKGEKVWIQPTFKWTSEDAKEYELYLGVEIDNLELVATTTVAEITLPYELPMDTTFFWKVVAKNDFGTNESDVEVFKTGKAPEFVQIVSPLDGEEDVWKDPELSWEFECADAYDVYLGKEATELELVVEDATSNTFVLQNLELGTTYYWKVVGKNRFGQAESPVVKFTVGNVPAVPYNPEPPDGAVDQFNNLVVRWESAKADAYDLYLGFSEDTLELYLENVKESAVEVRDLLFGTTYYWKVVAKNRFGNTEGPIWKFTTGQVPEQPKAIYPENGAQEVPVDVTLKWVSERAEEFELYFGTVKLELVGKLEINEYTLPQLHFGTQYNWKVVARNIFGEVESEVFTFRTKLPTVQKQEVLGGTGQDTSRRIIKTADGGYILVASTQSAKLEGFKGESDILVVKLTKELNVEWMKLLGGAGWDEAADVKEVEDGYIVLGYTLSKEIAGQVNKGGWDYLLAKLDKEGNIKWLKLYGGTGNDIPSRVIATSEGGFIIAGTTNSVNGDTGGNIGTWESWLLKLDAEGNILASRTFGGLDRDKAVDVVELEDGYLVANVTYSLEGNIPYNHGTSDIWLFKVSKDLKDITLNKAYGGTDQDEVSRIIKTNDGNFLMVGYTTSVDGDVQANAGFWDILVAKIDSKGEIIWLKTFGGTEEDIAYAAAEFPDGGFAIVGHTLSKVDGQKGAADIWLIDIDNDGNLRWSKTYGGSLADYASDVFIDEDGTIIIVGTSFSRNGDIGKNIGGSDIWIFKVK
ncbi:MAG: fibronectin type III domain-containing protein [Fervidobacterium sp.]|uniref:fibronectin type III domain-containing protein n=1 Tax=Fervidobacterium sp. TaxID=1871331 RepID=UPI0025C446DC|nr:fibronectin type III domain-containing protein [Fervidobacterium sp.]NPU89427.1 fibronectin type III domain-containing protein [Fervidobacterium sp.]